MYLFDGLIETAAIASVHYEACNWIKQQVYYTRTDVYIKIMYPHLFCLYNCIAFIAQISIC